MCSGVFIAERDPDAIRANELAYASPLFDAPGAAIPEYDTRSAVGTAARGFIKRRAAYRDGLGCTLLAPGSGVDDIEELTTLDTLEPLVDSASVPWPDGDLVADEPLPPEVDGKKLERAMNAIFDGKTYYDAESSWAPDLMTTGVVIVYNGRLIAERYAEGWGPHTELRTYSAAKSFTNAIAGIRVRQGQLNIDDPVNFPEWVSDNDPRRNITLRHFLNMSSGLECDGGATFSLPAYFGGGRNAGSEAATRELVAQPGTLWCYANFDSISVARTVRLTFDDVEEYLSFPNRALFSRIGMRNTFPETDVYDNFIMSSQIWSTPRDLARFGLLYLNDGVWNGERILPEGWVAFTQSPAPALALALALEGSPERGQNNYGAQFRLYNNNPQIPEDTFTAAGHGGQYSTIIPSHDLVIARMGLQNGKYQEFVADIVDAISSGADARGRN
jgi:CubicO group peptidase (beta-lactamase class C family)